MKTSVLIRNARMASGSCPADILVSGGVISGKAPAGTLSADSAETVIDASGKLLLPGLFDIHAHLCQPGREDKERIATATAAALHGGVTGLMAMPDTAPVMDNAAQITTFMEICRTDALVDVIPSGCLTKGDGGEEQASYDSLRAKGVRFITDGDRAPDNMLLLYRAMQYASNLNLTFALRGDVPALTARAAMHPGTTSYRLGLAGSPSCAEEIGLETIIRLSVDTGNSLHVQTVSTAGSADILRRCKPETTGLSAEVALHHLLFTHEDVGCYDTNYKTLPPLRDRKDVDALIEAVNDGTIDCIATDHAPHSAEEKSRGLRSLNGIVGLECAFPVLYTELVEPGIVPFATLLNALCVNPRRLFRLPGGKIEAGEIADLTVLDLNRPHAINSGAFFSRGRSTPFDGWTVTAGVDKTICNGNLVYTASSRNINKTPIPPCQEDYL